MNSNETQVLLTRNHQQSDRLMLLVVWVLFFISLGLSVMHDTLRWVLTVGLVTVLTASAAVYWASGSWLTRAVIATSFMVFSALQIHQAAGMTELHFGIFVLLAFLLCYRDWTIIIVASAVIAIHHVTFNYLQEWGYGVLCFTETGIGIVVTHATYVVAEAGVLSYLSIILRREALQAAELKSIVATLISADGSIDLRNNRTDIRSESGIALERAVRVVHDAMASVQRGITDMENASSQIAASNAELSSRTEQQASSLEETASSMEEMTSTVQHNAENAVQADKLATVAAQVATRGGEVVCGVVDTMSSITESSKRIKDIIGTIDGIAFQTNILALNAAVEAARAGEQGRGFAVVAAEVRALAQRSAAASKEIKELIGDSVQKVAVGSRLVQEAGFTMEEVVTSIKRVSGLVAEITVASQEQSSGITQVSQAVSQMDQMTQENSTLVETAAVSAASLTEKAALLSALVNTFRVDLSTVSDNAFITYKTP